MHHLCRCGCGAAAPLAKRTNRRLGHVKGQPLLYQSGHNRRGTTNLYRFTVEAGPLPTPCHAWTGPTDRKGYGYCQVGGIRKGAHRAVYEAKHGPVPSDLHIDHLCAVKRCINVGHLELVTPRENERRKRARLAVSR